MNYYPEGDGHFRDLDEDTSTSTELLAAHAPDARVVKAFEAKEPLLPNEARDLLSEPQ